MNQETHSIVGREYTLFQDRLFFLFVVLLVVFSSISVLLLPHAVEEGDAVGYIDAMHVLMGAPLDTSLVGAVIYAKQALLTTSFGLNIISLLSLVFGSITTAWLVWDTIAYFITNILFFALLRKMFGSSKTALIGGLFFAANYGMVIFGLTYFMDVGGWLFYCLSLFYLYSYVESGTQRDLYTAALAVGVGSLFKENAPFAYIAIVLVLLYENRSSWRVFIKRAIVPTLLAFVPMLSHHLTVFIAYNYGYWNFIAHNLREYHYSSRTVEYIKNFGSLLNLFAPVVLAGLYTMLRAGRDTLSTEFGMNTKKIVFIVAVVASSIPSIVWPGITQRVLFMIVPGLVLVACFFIKRYESRWYWFAPLIAVYAIASFLMDSYILNAVNLPF